MSQVDVYVQRLFSLQHFSAMDRGIIRRLGNREIGSDVNAYDVFVGLWRPTRKGDQQAAPGPSKRVAMLIMRLVAAYPVRHVGTHDGSMTLIHALALRETMLKPLDRHGYRRKINMLIESTEQGLDYHLHWALREVSKVVKQRRMPGIDWVQLTIDIGRWEVGNRVKTQWAQTYVSQIQGKRS